MKSSTKLLFSTMLISSTMMVMSSNNWLGMWMGLEINLLSFVALMYSEKNNKSAESCMIYFLIQGLGSMMFLMMILTQPMTFLLSNIMSNTCNTIMLSSMLLKAGAAPFHFWLPEMMEKMSWLNCTIMMTWQKIAPLSIMTFMIMSKEMIMLTVVLSTSMGAIGGLNQTSIRKIMAYSSISHLGWMIACMKFENEMWMMYLMIYALMIITMTWTFNYYSIFHINQMMINSPFMLEKIMYSLMFLSLGGLPPLLGFLPKWMVIQSLMSKSMYFMLFIMLMTTLITLFYYIRMASTLLLINLTTNKWSMKLKNNSQKAKTTIILLNLMLPFISIFSLF